MAAVNQVYFNLMTSMALSEWMSLMNMLDGERLDNPLLSSPGLVNRD